LEEYKKTNWAERREEFLGLVRSKKKHPVYDCIVPFSGGKDSASIAHRLKFDLGLTPLLVCYGQLLWTDVGRYNLHQVANAGFDIFYWRTNQEASRRLARRFFIERGHPKQHYDAAVNSVPVITALQFEVPLVVFAEHGESFYGGHVMSEEHRRRRDLAEVLENQVGDDARNWAGDGVTEADLYPYVMPDRCGEVEVVYYSYYFPWDIYTIAMYAKEKMKFRRAQNWSQGYGPRREGCFTGETIPGELPHIPGWWGKSDGSFEGFDSIDDKIDDLDYYMMYIKFLFGRSTRMASRLQQFGHLRAAHAKKLIELYDGEPPRTYLSDILAYMRMTEKEYHEIVDKHRDPDLWVREGKTWLPRAS